VRGGDEATARAAAGTRLGDRGQAGLDASFEEFCQQNFILVERFLLHQCPDHGLVEDAVQEAFVTARARWEQIRDYEKPLAWVYQTARYRLWMARHRGRPETTPEPDEPLPCLATPARPGAAAADGGLGHPVGAAGELPVTAAAARHLLRGWLRQLPPRQAEVFTLALDGWSDHEIARVLGIAYQTVRSYRHEARRRLEELARRDGVDPGGGRGRG